MFNDRIIKSYSISLYVEEMNKIHKTKAIFNQGDRNTSVIMVQLVNNKTNKIPIDLTGSRIIAKIMKSDSTTSTALCSILDKENGFVAIGLTEQALLALGENIIELEIQCGNQILYTPKMSYTVVDNLFDEQELLTSQDEFPILNSLIYNVQLLEQELVNLDSIVNEGEEIRKENEIQRKTEFENIKTTIDKKINLINQKIEELDNKLNKLEKEFL